MQKQILIVGSKLSYSYVVAKTLAKRGWKIVECDSMQTLISKVDEHSTVVLNWENTPSTIGVHGEEKGDKVKSQATQSKHTLTQDLPQQEYQDKLCDQSKHTSQDMVKLSTIRMLLNATQELYLNSIVTVPLDFRMFLDKQKTYDISSIDTVRMSELAYLSCADVISNNLTQAKLKIVHEEDVFDKLDQFTIAVANIYNTTRDLSMSASNLVEQTKIVKYCTISTTSKFDKNANIVWLAIKTKDKAVDIMSILSVLTFFNVELLSINTVDKYILVELEGNIKHKKTTQLITSLRELTKELRVLANI